MAAKRLELLRELVPGAAPVAVLVNPSLLRLPRPTLRACKRPRRAIGLQIQILDAGTSREIDTVFAAFVRERPDALFLGGILFLMAGGSSSLLVAARHALPVTYARATFPKSAG